MVVLLGDCGPLGFNLRGPFVPIMGDDDETHLPVTYASHFNMDAAFCARMRAAIAAGLESALTGVIATPGTRNPKYVRTELPPLASSLSDKNFV